MRLNPNVPWKTRGNAALSARFGVGRGPRMRVGEVAGRPVWSHARGGPLPPARRGPFLERTWDRVLQSARLGENGTDPALVAVPRRLPAAFYYRSVRQIVPVEEARRLLEASGAWVRAEGDGRGVVGAAAAVAWPARKSTWELIAYRPPAREGAPRRVDSGSVRAAARHFPGLFLCDDPRTRRLLVTPHTPCPILFGLRGVDRRAPLRARAEVVSESVDRWVVFRTNQGTGDHLTRRPVAEIGKFESARVLGRVAEPPRIERGGHARMLLRDTDGTLLDTVAFEPTKTLPRVVAALAPGDRVEVWGSRDSGPTLKLEGVRVISTVTRLGTPTAPTCPECHRPTRSLGTSRGFRCPACRRRFPPEAGTRRGRPTRIAPGVYHPTPSARRHLAPLGPEP